MGLGLPFQYYIVVFEISIWASVIAMQCDRRERGSWYAKAFYDQHASIFWIGLYMLGSVSWLALIALAFFQFKVLTALGWLAIGAISAALIPAWAGLYRRDVEHLIIIHRIAHAVALASTIYLWLQAITAHR